MLVVKRVTMKQRALPHRRFIDEMPKGSSAFASLSFDDFLILIGDGGRQVVGLT